ncbi:kinase-like protein [Ramaria rubella]|nr:kinase-like protein [Ramaria rubella]
MCSQAGPRGTPVSLHCFKSSLQTHPCSYLHINGFIHRDVKAANLLIDDDGTVLLGDLGVATALNDEDHTSTRYTTASISDVISPKPTIVDSNNMGIRKRKSFVGTPCWMAPEVVSQRHYDSKADIWSLGITALELAQGKAPRYREPPHKVFMKTIQDAPPILDREGGQFKYSKAFKEVIQSCLTKDPSERPTAESLLQTPFFKSSKKKGFLVGALLNGLPPLIDRQQRRRIPSALTRLSVESWDFSHTGMISPTSIRTGESPETSIFEMEVPGNTVEAPREDEQTSGAAPEGLRTERDDLVHGEYTDEEHSTPPTSPPSSFPTSSIIASSPRPGKPVPSASPPLKGFPLSTSPGLWKRLKGVSSRTTLDRVKTSQC